MTHTYTITGMTCNGCVAKAKSELLKLGDIRSVEVQLQVPQATITMQKHIPLTVLQNTIGKAGNFNITEEDSGKQHVNSTKQETSWLTTYKPILLIAAYIVGATLLVEVTRGQFNWDNWMQNFMAAFFLVFSFFKLLDVKGFAESYSTYDIIARRWTAWGYMYAFLELALGIAYLLRFNPLITNAVTFAIMSISIVGVLQTVLNKKTIQCACLGSVFKLPMSRITIIEDGLMIVMSLLTLISVF